MNYQLNKLGWGQQIELPSSRALRSTTHIVGGKYPCRSVAYIPRLILNELSSSEPLCILDPFMGSGTTAVETIIRGFRPFGLEVDPFARLISGVSTHGYSKDEILEIENIHNTISKNFYSHNPDVSLKPKMNNIEYWFDEANFKHLLSLKSLIYLNCSDINIKRFFLAVLADIIRAASKAERQSLKPYISKKYIKARNDVFVFYNRSFLSFMNAICSSSVNFDGALINWLDGDATNFTTSVKMDCAITSPPYINAMDYVRCIKLESAWIDTGDDQIFSEIRRKQLGEQARIKENSPNELVLKVAGPKLMYLKDVDNKRYKMALSYFQDMHDNLKCVYDALKYNCCYHIIIGNSVIRSIEVETHLILSELARFIGFEWISYFAYPIKDHRTSLPRNGNGGKIAIEHVLCLRKS